jgi:hypothetical protein
MAVGIAQKNLESPIRPQFAGKEISAFVLQVDFPGVEVIDLQGEVIASIAGNNRGRPVADEVKFLSESQAKPGPGEVERGARHRFKPEDAGVEIATTADIGDVQRNVVQFLDVHKLRNVRSLGHARKGRQETYRAWGRADLAAGTSGRASLADAARLADAGEGRRQPA